MAALPPDSQRLAVELGSCLLPGVTVRALAQCPSVLGLAIVRAKAASGSKADRAVAARDLLRN